MFSIEVIIINSIYYGKNKRISVLHFGYEFQAVASNMKVLPAV